MDRRKFLWSFGLSILTPFKIVGQLSAFDSDSAERDQIFSLSIASGDPSPHGIMLWTRINPETIKDPHEPLYLQIAEDANFQSIYRNLRIEGSQLLAARDYTVSIDLCAEKNVRLEANHRYYYRFIYRKVSSRIGRCKTLPLANAELDSLRLAVVSCQEYSSGFYHAYDAIAADQELDFVVHLGDFIYEYARVPVIKGIARSIDIPQDVALTLEDFRQIYRTYRSDRSLQKAMENHSFIITADDHETANNCYWDYESDSLGLSESHPLAKASAERRMEFKLHAQQAWGEYVPARVKSQTNATHAHDYQQIYRSFKFGKLAEIFMTDSRSYRSKAHCEDKKSCKVYEEMPDYQSSERTMLGQTQRNWLQNGLIQSEAHWKIWGNQTLLSQFGLLEPIHNKVLTYLAGYDAWDGYRGERYDLLKSLLDAKLENFVVLTGDMHAYAASLVKLDYSKLDNKDDDNIVGLEIMTPAISSPTLAQMTEYIDASDTKRPGFMKKLLSLIGKNYQEGGWKERLLDKLFVRKNNPHILDFGAIYNGYTKVTFLHDRVEWELIAVDKFAKSLSKNDLRIVRKNSYSAQAKS